MSLIRRLLSQYSWDLAFGVYDESIIINGIETNSMMLVKNPYRKKWFADPFILTEDEKSFQILVEEFDRDVKKGRIARLKISKPDFKITECAIVLELSTHVSFPAIYREGNNIYVHPENSASGKSTIYRYDIEHDKLVDPIVLVDKPLTDAVIIKIDNRYIMYSTLLPQNGGPLLHVFKSDALLHPFEEVASIDYRKKTARMAGAYLPSSSGLIRPAQDCTHDYGEAVIFYNDNEIVGEIRPNHNGKYAGIHTFNTFGDTFIVDLKKYNYANLRRFLKGIFGLN